jgi:RNA polymerase sigma-70 factor (ECF subfamily)
VRAVATDEELMVQLQTGDESALALLIDRWRGPLYGFLHRRVAAAATDDLFQETWLRVVRARGRFDPSRRFSTWLFQIANNLCRDRGRRAASWQRTREVLARGADEPPREAPLELRLDVRRRVASLPERLREVLVLRYFAGLAEPEIAEVAGIPRGTVKSRLHAAVRALRAQEQTDHGD